MRTASILMTLGLLLASACSDDGGDTEPGVDAPPATYNHDVDIQPIWTASCVQCHANYTDGYSAMVGVPTGQGGMSRIEPGDPDNSYVWRKLQNTHLDVGGSGNPMPPPPFELLSADQLDMIQTWILEGAPR